LFTRHDLYKQSGIHTPFPSTSTSFGRARGGIVIVAAGVTTSYSKRERWVDRGKKEMEKRGERVRFLEK